MDYKIKLDRIEEKELLYDLYNTKKPIKCLRKIYYGSHNKNSNYNYAFKIEYIPL